MTPSITSSTYWHRWRQHWAFAGSRSGTVWKRSYSSIRSSYEAWERRRIGCTPTSTRPIGLLIESTLSVTPAPSLRYQSIRGLTIMLLVILIVRAWQG